MYIVMETGTEKCRWWGAVEWRRGEGEKSVNVTSVGGAISSLGVKEEAREELSSNAEDNGTRAMGN